MNMLEKLLICGLAVTVGFGLTGCDEETEGECNEAGVCADGGAGGEGGVGGGIGGEGGEGGGAEEPVFDQVIIEDTSADENMAGTPGVDICSVASDCGEPTGAMLEMGGGTLCTAVGEGCSAVRTDANAALSFEMDCEALSDPSHYVSLGMGGTLTVMFGESQAGCGLTIIELEGNDAESFDVSVCTADGDCLTTSDGSAVLGSGNGGSASIQVPAYEAGEE